MNDSQASREIDSIISAQEPWKKDILTQLRALILSAAPLLIEEVKWKTASRPEGLPVWSHNGIVCMTEIWKDNIKLIFPKGAQLPDPHGLFNARLQSEAVRAVEFRKDDTIQKAALEQLVTEATTLTDNKS